jgi:hypothetical protein
VAQPDVLASVHILAYCLPAKAETLRKAANLAARVPLHRISFTSGTGILVRQEIRHTSQRRHVHSGRLFACTLQGTTQQHTRSP